MSVLYLRSSRDPVLGTSSLFCIASSHHSGPRVVTMPDPYERFRMHLHIYTTLFERGVARRNRVVYGFVLGSCF